MAIILAVSLITTVGLFFKGSQAAQIENVKRLTGTSFHVGISNYDQETLDKVENNPNIDTYGLMSQGETIKLDDINVQYNYANKQAMKFLMYSIKKGRVPKNAEEAALDEWVIPYIHPNLKLHDSFVFNGKKYELVGLLENQDYTQEQKSGRFLTFKDTFTIGEGRILTSINPKSDMNKTIDGLKSLSDEKNIVVNHQLVKLLHPDKTMMSIVAIAISIVVISTIVVIYNAFQISVVERIKQFGLLRSIGATRKQLREIVLSEASILVFLAIPIGVLFSFLAVFILNLIFSYVMDGDNSIIQFAIDWKVVGICSLITMATVYASSYFPALFAGKISPLLAISSRLYIKKEGTKKQKRKTMKRPFSLPLSLALKNVKRNKNRYNVTILSIIISCVLFITFSFLMDIAFKTNTKKPSIIDITISINQNQASTKDIESIYKKLKQTYNIASVYKQYREQPFQITVPENKQIDVLRGRNMESSIKAYDQPSLHRLKDLVINGDIGDIIDSKQLNQHNGVILVKNGRSTNAETNKLYIGPLSNFKVGDKVNLTITGKEGIHTAQIMAIVESDLFSDELSNSLTFISSQEVVERITKSSPQFTGYGITTEDVSLDTSTSANIKQLFDSNQNISIINHIDMNNKASQNMLLIKVLVYGFMVVITLISSVNILNTITVSIIMRRKELAALKSIGMSQKNLKKMITYEGIIYGFFGSLQGIFFGLLLSYIIYLAISGTVEIGWSLPYQACLITFVAAIIISYLSVRMPLKKIERDNVIDVIREE